jgi:hypothetical protein
MPDIQSIQYLQNHDFNESQIEQSDLEKVLSDDDDGG